MHLESMMNELFTTAIMINRLTKNHTKMTNKIIIKKHSRTGHSAPYEPLKFDVYDGTTLYASTFNYQAAYAFACEVARERHLQPWHIETEPAALALAKMQG